MAKRIRFTNVAAAVVRQAYRRIAVDLGGPMRSVNLRTVRGPVFEAFPTVKAYSDSRNGLQILDGQFTFCGQTLDVGAQGDPWSNPSPSERFAYRLHSFDWLDELAAIVADTKLSKTDPQTTQKAISRARFLIDRWITLYGDWNPYSWDNDILANRVFAWFVNWRELLTEEEETPEGVRRRRNLNRQLKRLKNTYNRTPSGLPKLKAAACLCLAGTCFSGRQEDYLNRGLDLLDDEIELQILADGGHVSRNPQQTVEALEILSAVESALENRDIPGSKEIRRAIDRLIPTVNFFTSLDGGLFSFNGSGEGQPATVKYFTANTNISSKKFKFAPHSGYQRLERNNTVIMVDTGESPPRPFDLDAHLAPLAFEMATDSGRLIVNCGWNEEQPSQWREPMRATAAHSTLVLDNKSAGKFLSSGLGAQVIGPAIFEIAGPTRSSRKEQETGTWLEATHEGYKKSHGLAHRRRLYLDILGSDFRGEDSLFIPLGETPLSNDQIPFSIRFHLHPSVKVTLAQDQNSALLIQPGGQGWRFRTDGGPLKLEKSVYLSKGSAPQRSEQLVINGSAYGDGDGQARTNRVRWTLKRMGKIDR